VLWTLSCQEPNLQKKRKKLRNGTNLGTPQNKYTSLVASYSRIIGSNCKHLHFYIFDHDRRFSLLDVTWANRRVGASPFSFVFGKKTISSSLPRHCFNSDWRHLGKLHSCD
jgi:hypothetical protein